MNHMTIAEKTAMLASKEQVDHHTEQSSLNEVDELLKDEKFLVLRNMWFNHKTCGMSNPIV